MLLPLLIAVALFTPAAANGPQYTNVFTSGQEGYHSFRIPSLIVTQKKTLLAFCEGRKTSRSDHGDLDLVLKRSSDMGKTWSRLQVVYEEGGSKKVTIGNPCPVIDRATGTIWLPFCRDNDDVFVTHSSDDGKTWSKPVEITGDVKRPDWGWYATGPGVGIHLSRGPHKGRLVIPSDHKRPVDGKQEFFSHVIYSDDAGKSWKLGGVLPKHTNECQVVELEDGSLMINMRNYWGRNGGRPDRGGRRTTAISRDGGESWQELTFDTTLIEPICQASFLRYTTKRQHGKNRLLFSNPASKKTRHRLNVRLSHDEGKTWPLSRVLHAGPSAYSCLTVLPDKSIGCLYEGGTKTAYDHIRFARFTLDWLSNGKDRVK